MYTHEQLAMTLAAIAYGKSEKIELYLSDPRYATEGKWKLAWHAESQGNLMYVASHSSMNQYAVAIRGTLPGLSITFLENLYEDTCVGRSVQWPYAGTQDARIASGAMAGVENLLGMTSHGATIIEYLCTIPKGAGVLVTGHSLGGCLASALAPALSIELAKKNQSLDIQPYTFAAPTAGNETFAKTYPAFTHQVRCYNKQDLVPMAWNNLSGIKELFQNGPECPFELKGIIDAMIVAMNLASLHYAPPNIRELPIPPMATRSNDFLTEMIAQHDPNTYLLLLGAPVMPFTVSFDWTPRV